MATCVDVDFCKLWPDLGPKVFDTQNHNSSKIKEKVQYFLNYFKMIITQKSKIMKMRRANTEFM